MLLTLKVWSGFLFYCTAFKESIFLPDQENIQRAPPPLPPTHHSLTHTSFAQSVSNFQLFALNTHITRSKLNIEMNKYWRGNIPRIIAKFSDPWNWSLILFWNHWQWKHSFIDISWLRCLWRLCGVGLTWGLSSSLHCRFDPYTGTKPRFHIEWMVRFSPVATYLIIAHSRFFCS